ncbi:ferritin-like domain-containing protein [Streptomyces aurantiogriseus]|uniref:Iminophenyl-pyruvate dimer synthase domain-containing protein n=1 Tax=Streptomyces aurantiogriseus TaxID=66870 RepID=A0A918FK33_9ACTN|nr:ferritin-like protein [Streptomyces aurantiogriseus]GGR44844.1 hypothetical protein GCM10010251_72330 [Streptomyces aurantiogriseus]
MTQPTPISTLTDLKAALQLAIGVELSTIPVYLTALYSIEEGRNTDAAQTIRSVVMEEMLHMTLAANVLNALSEVPSVEPVTFQGHEGLVPVPGYPLDSPLISGIGTLRLLPFSPQAVDGFVRIEHPLHGAADVAEIAAGACGYRTIGEFYGAITLALKDPAICPDSAFQHRNQVPDTQYYGGAGHVVEVRDRASALQAVRTIVDEGEGLPPEHLEHEAKKVTTEDRLRSGWQMYSHYARFRELQTGRRFRTGQLANEDPEGALLLVDYGAVHPALYVPRNGDRADGPEGAALIEFDLAYSGLVDGLYRAFSGEPQALPRAVHAMHELRSRAVALMRTRIPADPAHTLCPRFSYLPLGDREKQARQAVELREQSR